MAVLGAVAGVLWWKLPQWAPWWVVRHSPWLDPVMRVRAEQSYLPLLQLDHVHQTLGPRFAHAVAPYLEHGDQYQRELVASWLAWNAEDPGALDALIAAAETGSRESADALRFIAEPESHALEPGAAAYPATLRARAAATLERLGAVTTPVR